MAQDFPIGTTGGCEIDWCLDDADAEVSLSAWSWLRMFFEERVAATVNREAQSPENLSLRGTARRAA